MKQSFEYLKQVVALREKGNYYVEDMSEDEEFDASKIYWGCFAETPEGRECILVYGFDRAEYGEQCPCETAFDNAEYAVMTIPCNSWK